MLFRETERDWDKDLADDVKEECEGKFGAVEAIKVEKDTQVCFSTAYPALLVNMFPYRVKFMLSLTRLSPPRKQSKVSTDAGSTRSRFRPHSLLMR